MTRDAVDLIGKPEGFLFEPHAVARFGRYTSPVGGRF
jgi:hypothetical protein